MTRDEVNKICAALPGATLEHPWGDDHDAWKLCGKMFAGIGSIGECVSVKTPSIEEASFLIELGRATKAKYFHRSWVSVPLGGAVAHDEMRDRIHASYSIIRKGLTKKLQANLPPFPSQ